MFSDAVVEDLLVTEFHDHYYVTDADLRNDYREEIAGNDPLVVIANETLMTDRTGHPRIGRCTEGVPVEPAGSEERTQNRQQGRLLTGTSAAARHPSSEFYCAAGDP